MVHVILHLSICIECTTLKVNPNANYGLWVIMMCQSRFVDENKKCTTLVGDVDSRGGYTCFETAGIWDISVPSFQFCCEPRTALKKSCKQ